MSPVEALRVIFRHWLIITFGLALSIAATVAGYVTIPNSYSSSSVVMVLQRSTKATASGENPYLTMDASLTVTAAAVQRAVSDSPVMSAALTAIDASGTFLVTPVMSGPFLQIDTGATTPADTLAIQQLVRDQMRLMLTTLQSSVGAPSNLQIQLNEVTQPTKPVAVLKRKLQYVGAILFGGLALTVSLAFLADRIRSRRKGGAVPEQTPEQTPDHTPEQADAGVPDPAGVVGPHQPVKPRPQVPGPAMAPQPRPGHDRIWSGGGTPRKPDQPVPTAWTSDDPARLDERAERAELAFVPPHEEPHGNRTRNGRNGFPAAPATPDRGWSHPDAGHGTGQDWRHTPEPHPAGRSQPEQNRR